MRMRGKSSMQMIMSEYFQMKVKPGTREIIQFNHSMEVQTHGQYRQFVSKFYVAGFIFVCFSPINMEYAVHFNLLGG